MRNLTEDEVVLVGGGMMEARSALAEVSPHPL